MKWLVVTGLSLLAAVLALYLLGASVDEPREAEPVAHTPSVAELKAGCEAEYGAGTSRAEYCLIKVVRRVALEMELASEDRVLEGAR